MQIGENYMKQVTEIIKNQISTISNYEERGNIIKALKASTEKNLGYNHKEKRVETQTFCTIHQLRKISR